MKTKEKDLSEIEANTKFNIVSLLLLDHNYLKSCIKVLKDKDEDKAIKLKFAKTFIDALKKHTLNRLSSNTISGDFSERVRKHIITAA